MWWLCLCSGKGHPIIKTAGTAFSEQHCTQPNLPSEDSPLYSTCCFFFNLFLFFNEIMTFFFFHYCVGSFNKTFTSSTIVFLLRPPDQISRGNMQEFQSNKPLIWVLMDTIRCLWWFLMDVSAAWLEQFQTSLGCFDIPRRDGVKLW